MNDINEKFSLETLASDFTSLNKENLSKELLQNISNQIKQAPRNKTETSYGGNGAIVTVIIWTKVTFQITGGKEFVGKSWGIGFPGGGAIMGDIYLRNATSLNDLYARANNFTVISTPVYLNILIFEGSTLLADIECGAISVTAGTFAGTDIEWV